MTRCFLEDDLINRVIGYVGCTVRKKEICASNFLLSSFLLLLFFCVLLNLRCDCDYRYSMIDRTHKQASGQHAYRQNERRKAKKKKEKRFHLLSISISLSRLLLRARARARAMSVCSYLLSLASTFVFARTSIYRFLAFAFTTRVV